MTALDQLVEDCEALSSDHIAELFAIALLRVLEKSSGSSDEIEKALIAYAVFVGRYVRYKRKLAILSSQLKERRALHVMRYSESNAWVAPDKPSDYPKFETLEFQMQDARLAKNNLERKLLELGVSNGTLLLVRQRNWGNPFDWTTAH